LHLREQPDKLEYQRLQRHCAEHDISPAVTNVRLVRIRATRTFQDTCIQDTRRSCGRQTSRANPAISRSRMISQATSISHDICPLRVEREWALWLLGHPSLLLTNAMIALLRLWSAVA